MLRRILGLLGWVGVVFVLSAVAIAFLKPEWEAWRFRLALAGLACVLLYLLSQWREIGRDFSRRQVRFGTLAIGSAVVVLAILVAINYLASRHNKRWDLTAAKQFSLSDQTKKILESLDKPVHIRVFASSDDFERFRERLEEYQYVSKQVTVEYIDAVKRPALANQYNVQALGTIVLEYEGRTERVSSDGEQELTNGLIKLVQGTQHKVYFVQGHGEKSSESTDPRSGYSAIASALGSDNFAVDKLVLAQVKEVPADASALIVAGPKTDFFPTEMELVKAYLARGGKIFFLLDPPDRSDSPELTNVAALLKDWGIELGNNVVVDVSGMGRMFGADASVPVAARYEPHPITDRFELITAYPLARSVTPIAGGVNGRSAQPLVQTSPSSWAETDIKRLTTSGQVEREIERGDTAGPVTLASVVSAPAAGAAAPPDPAKAEAAKTDGAKAETRIAVFGDSDFATNGSLGIRGNRDLFLNTVSWLAQQENLIAIRPKDPEDRRITLTRDQHLRIFLLTVFIIPGLILLAGVQTWWRRR